MSETDPMTLYSDYLRQHLDQNSIKAVLAICQRTHFTIDQALVNQGVKTSALFFVPCGIVRHYLIDDEGREANKTFTKAPCVVGSTRALLTEQESTINVASLTDTLGLTISWPKFRHLLSQHHSIESYYRMGLERLFLVKDRRESSFLLNSPQDRYLEFVEQHADIWQQIPQYHIATYLGITPVSLSRIRARLKQQGF